MLHFILVSSTLSVIFYVHVYTQSTYWTISYQLKVYIIQGQLKEMCTGICKSHEQTNKCYWTLEKCHRKQHTNPGRCCFEWMQIPSRYVKKGNA